MLYRDGEHAQDATGNAATELRLAHASAATAAASVLKPERHQSYTER